MKKLLAILLTLALVLSLAACGGGNSENYESDEAGENTNVSENSNVNESIMFREDDTMIEKLLNSYWKYNCFGDDRYAKGFEKVITSETDANGVVVKRVYSGRYGEKIVIYNPADNTLIINDSVFTFDESGKPIRGAFVNDNSYTTYSYTYDEAGYLIARSIPRYDYTYEYSSDRKTMKIFCEGELSEELEYDDNGILSLRTVYDRYGDWLTSITYVYDQDGRRFETYSVGKDGERDSRMEKREYDEKGNLIKCYN